MPQPVRSIITLVSLTLLFLVLASSNGYSRIYEVYDPPKPYIIPGIVSVQFEDDLDLSNLQKTLNALTMSISTQDKSLSQLQITRARKIFPEAKEKPPVNSGQMDLTRYYELGFDTSLNVNEVVLALLEIPEIRMAEAVWAQPLEAVPDDPEWTTLWHRNNLELANAWDLETGSDSVKIAIVDSGVNYKHPDLVDNIWVNPGEDIDGDGAVYDLDDLNGIDDDGNGRIDDLIGYDFLTGIGATWPGEDGNTPDTDPNDFDGHGTHCSGIAAAVTNNTTDVVGISGGWANIHRSYRGARIMCLRAGATGSDGRGYVNPNDCATAIFYAAFNGADVINCSWGGSSVQQAAVTTAIFTYDAIVCHAAGNDNSNSPDAMDNFPGVLSVASTTSTDHKSSFSNYGPWVDLSAPGSAIKSTYSFEYTPGVAVLSGTSMASPMVVGLAALIRSAMPSLDFTQIIGILQSTADDINDINPTYAGQLGAGRINAYNAMQALAIAHFTSDNTDGNIPLTVNFADMSPNSPTSWNWTFGDGGSSMDQNPSHTYTQPGIYDVSLIIDDPNGQGEENLQRYVWAQADTIIIDSVEGYRGAEVAVPVYLNNTALIKYLTLAFTIPNVEGSKLDSASMAGLRTDYFYNLQYTGYDVNNRRYAITLESSAPGESHYLPPDTGVVVYLYVYIHPDAVPGSVLTIDTLSWGGGRIPTIKTIYGDYWPVFVPGKISVYPCVRGDVDCSGGEPDISDIVALIQNLYLEPKGEPVLDPYAANVNGEGDIDISDIVYLIAWLYLEGPPPPA